MNGSTATQTFALTVAANPLPGFAAPVPFMRHPLNREAEQTLPAPTNMDNRDLTFVVTPGLPTGLRYVPPMKVGGEYTMGGQIVGTPTAETLVLPAATNGDGRLTYTLTPPGLPAGLTYTPPAAGDATGGTLAGTPTAVHPMTTYTLPATDADGDPAELTFTVEVGAAGAIRSQDGTRTYTVNGQPVTVTQAPGTLAGIALTVTQPATLDGAVTITLRPPGADVPLVRDRYGFGPVGARAVGALTVAPVPAGGLVRYAGQQWDPAADVEDDATAGQVCAAGATAFGPLAVGYANAVPTFGDEPVGALSWQVNAAQAVTAWSATRWSRRPCRRG